MILRLCLKDKSSVLINSSMIEINEQIKECQFIIVENYNTKKLEMYNKDYIWCVRISSENDKENNIK